MRPGARQRPRSLEPQPRVATSDDCELASQVDSFQHLTRGAARSETRSDLVLRSCRWHIPSLGRRAGFLSSLTRAGRARNARRWTRAPQTLRPRKQVPHAHPRPCSSPRAVLSRLVRSAVGTWGSPFTPGDTLRSPAERGRREEGLCRELEEARASDRGPFDARRSGVLHFHRCPVCDCLDIPDEAGHTSRGKPRRRHG